VPGRDVTLGDFLADVARAAFGAVTAFSLGKNRLAAR
jgi:hypothetical protein